MRIASTLLILILLMIGGIFLQIFLSKKQNKWLGRILPILTFTFSVLMGFLYFLSFLAGTPISQICITMLLVFLLYNIPTIVLCLIYKACRETMHRNTQVEKMNIQDL